jgi:hypothetical protein
MLKVTFEHPPSRLTLKVPSQKLHIFFQTTVTTKSLRTVYYDNKKGQFPFHLRSSNGRNDGITDDKNETIQRWGTERRDWLVNTPASYSGGPFSNLDPETG